jgi:hypothetical protein
MFKHLFTTKRRSPQPRQVRRQPDPMPRIRWYA